MTHKMTGPHPERPRRQTALVGTGSIAESLALVMASTGYPIHSIISRQADRARALAQTARAPHALTLGDPLPEGIELLFLCVPDDVIEPLSRTLAQHSYDWSSVVVAHTSGARSSVILSDLAQAGAFTMSFHPMQTFKPGGGTAFEGIYVGLEGHPEAVEVGQQIARHLGSIPVTLSTEAKIRYHAAAVFASNFLATVASLSCDLLASTGIDRSDALNMLRPLIAQTCSNIDALSPDDVLTGPAVRGDADTIDRHREDLRLYSSRLKRLYELLTVEALDIAMRTGRLSESNGRTLLNQLHPGNT